jgi:hypothetical protein
MNTVKRSVAWPSKWSMSLWRSDVVHTSLLSTSDGYHKFEESPCPWFSYLDTLTGHRVVRISGSEGGRGMLYGGAANGEIITTSQIYLESEADSLKSSVRIPGHWFHTGQLVTVDTAGGSTFMTPIGSGLGTRGSRRYIIKVDNNYIRFARSIDSADAGQYIPITNAGSGATRINYCEYWCNWTKVLQFDSVYNHSDSTFTAGKYLHAEVSGDTLLIKQVNKTGKAVTVVCEWLGNHGATPNTFYHEAYIEYNNRACTDTTGHGTAAGPLYAYLKDAPDVQPGHLFCDFATVAGAFGKGGPVYIPMDIGQDGLQGDSAKIYAGIKRFQDHLDSTLGHRTVLLFFLYAWQEQSADKDSLGYDLRAATIAYAERNPSRAVIASNGANMPLVNEANITIARGDVMPYPGLYVQSVNSKGRARVSYVDSTGYGTYGTISGRLYILSPQDTGFGSADSFLIYTDSLYTTKIGYLVINAITRIATTHYTTAAQMQQRGAVQLKNYFDYKAGIRTAFGFPKIYHVRQPAADSLVVRVVTAGGISWGNGYGNTNYHYGFDALKADSSGYVYATSGTKSGNEIHLHFAASVVGHPRYFAKSWITATERAAMTGADTSQVVFQQDGTTGLCGTWRNDKMMIADSLGLSALPYIYGTSSNAQRFSGWLPFLLRAYR